MIKKLDLLYCINNDMRIFANNNNDNNNIANKINRISMIQKPVYELERPELRFI